MLAYPFVCSFNVNRGGVADYDILPAVFPDRFSDSGSIDFAIKPMFLRLGIENSRLEVV